MKRWEVLIIDDSARFALHVWRYLTSSLGFGNGEVGVDGIYRSPAGESTWIHEAQPILSEDGCLRLWWISASCETERALELNVFKRFQNQEPFYALVDVHGKSGYSAASVCRWLDERREHEDSEICLVSAYHTMHHLSAKGDPLPVLPKSRETLRRIAGRLVAKPKSPIAQSGVRHVLVTGAGFEIRSARGGLGLPPTTQIFEGMKPYLPAATMDPRETSRLEFGPVPEDGMPAPSSAFPIPQNGLWEKSEPALLLSLFARTGNLDAYWDVLLEKECQTPLGGTAGDVKKRDKAKSDLLLRERHLREAFRRSMLHHDWGFMNQSLDAAQMPLQAWLTTNYTQFADRAISLCGGLWPELGAWRTIATAGEARTLIRERVGTSNQDNRYLFKLHGDISHLQTMAIAGHDKDSFSPLSMPMEDIYQVYAAAEMFLLESFQKTKPSLIVWHIVGHGLQDRSLCALLARVWAHTPSEQVFAIVNPHPADPVKHLREKLDELKGTKEGPVLCECGLYAAQYMSRLLMLLRGGDEECCEVRDAGETLRWLEKARSLGDPPSSQSLF